LRTNGVKYIILPDNTNVDLTPHVAGVDYYTFTIDPPQKYHSYFEAFVEPSSFRPLETGHAFWRFSTDIPTDTLQYMNTNQNHPRTRKDSTESLGFTRE
jgi:hypothetical protein